MQARKENKSLRDALPPLTTKTLLDSELQQAGFSADDFRNATYRAHQLIYIADCWADSEMTLAELQWKETFSFFLPEQLKTAGYDITDLLPPQRTLTAFGPLYNLIGRWARCFPEPLDLHQHLLQAIPHEIHDCLTLRSQ